MKERSTQHSVDEVRTVIKKCLEEAALVNYTRISEFAKIEGSNIMLCGLFQLGRFFFIFDSTIFATYFGCTYYNANAVPATAQLQC